MSLGDIQPKVIGVNQGSAMQLIEQKILQVAVGPAVTFSNIPQNFSHLHLKLVARCADASTQTNLSLRLNGDGGSNYSDQLFITSNTSISAAHDSAATYAYLDFDFEANFIFAVIVQQYLNEFTSIDNIRKITQF